MKRASIFKNTLMTAIGRKRVGDRNSRAYKFAKRNVR
jgi:hypothetical protein